MTLQKPNETVYDYPAYWDLAFQDETADEADFVFAASKKWLGAQPTRVYEPGCGGGRLVVELLNRGVSVSASDLSDACVRFVRERAAVFDATCEVARADMRSFVAPELCDLAICPVNTIRHLLSEADVQSHLSAVAQSVKPGGLYIIGLHLMPPDADEEDSESWTETDGQVTVEATLNVIAFDRKSRLERLKFELDVSTRSGQKRLVSEFDYRLYTAAEMRQTLDAAADWSLISVHDFWYDIDESFPLNDDLGDTVLVLRRR